MLNLKEDQQQISINIFSELISSECKSTDSVYNDTIRVFSALNQQNNQMLVSMDFVGIWVLSLDSSTKELKTEYF